MARNAGELVSKPVIDTAEGRSLGRVKDAMFEPEQHLLYGLLVETEAGDRFLARDAVRGFGADAVTVDGEGAITDLGTESRARELMESGIRLRGTKVITETGDSLGTVDKIMIEDDGSVVCYQTASGLLGIGERHEVPPSRVMRIGTDAIIVAAVAEDDDADEAGATGTRASGKTIITRVNETPDTAGAREAAVQANGDPAGSTGAPVKQPAASTAEPVDLNQELEPEGSITSGDAPDPFPASTKADAASKREPSKHGGGADGNAETPEGTDATKQTLVSVPDSQPGNLIDDEKPA